jgi:hypothetical protein
MRLNDAGRLEGNGTVRPIGANPLLSVANGSVIAPGLAGAGAIRIEAGLRVFEDSGLELELRGTEAGTEYDYLEVLGTSVLDGTLSVTLLDTAPGTPFQPSAGAVFDLIRAQSIQDLGFELLLPELFGGLAWQSGIVAEAGSELLRIRVVPEPGTAGLVLLGLLTLGALRAQRR